MANPVTEYEIQPTHLAWELYGLSTTRCQVWNRRPEACVGVATEPWNTAACLVLIVLSFFTWTTSHGCCKDLPNTPPWMRWEETHEGNVTSYLETELLYTNSHKGSVTSHCKHSTAWYATLFSYHNNLKYLYTARSLFSFSFLHKHILISISMNHI